MGIVNVTPDSFSDGDPFATVDQQVEHALQLIDEGADILDIGGESTRPGSDPGSLDNELSRVIPVIERIRAKSDVLISIDTTKSAVAQAALDAGANIVNDISALRFDPEMAELISDRGVPVVLMHMLGTPRDMQQNPSYIDCVGEIIEFFKERLAFCSENNIDESAVILDPGIGFGKRLADNLDILSSVDRFESLGCPILIGASRKSFIQMIDERSDDAAKRIGGSIASALVAAQNGASILRVHDVKETIEALNVDQAIRNKQ
jgi:dihydropteroate synthase